MTDKEIQRLQEILASNKRKGWNSELARKYGAKGGKRE